MSKNHSSGTRSFGYRRVGGAFREVLALDERGITIKRLRLVPWSNVVAKRTYPNFYQDRWLGWFQPRLRIYVRDGRSYLFLGAGLLAREDAGGRRKRGWGELPASYRDLIAQLDYRGIPDWSGPREEVTLLQVGMALAIFGGLLGYALATGGLLAKSVDVDDAVGVGWVGLGLLSFAVTPFIARRRRRNHVARQHEKV